MRITRLLFSAVLFSIIAGFGCAEKTPPAFTISGHLKNPRSGKIILTQEEDINRKKSRFIETIKPDREGHFELDLALEPHLYTINFYDEKKITLAIGRGQEIKIKADGADLSKVKVSGSRDTALLEEYEEFRKESLERLVISVRDRLKATGDYNNTESEIAGIDEISNYEKHKAELNEFIKRKMGDSIALYATTLRWDGQENIPFFKSMAAAFEKEHGGIEITKRINEKIELLEQTGIGGKAAKMKMPDKDGNIIPFEPSKSRYTLVDFWASWCGPCRRESKTVAALYRKYKADGFEIYGVSLDDDRVKWLDAIDKDGRIWNNVSTLTGYDTDAAFDYAVTSLPAKFLVDSDGRIVSRNLHGRELEKKLKELYSE